MDWLHNCFCDCCVNVDNSTCLSIQLKRTININTWLMINRPTNCQNRQTDKWTNGQNVQWTTTRQFQGTRRQKKLWSWWKIKYKDNRTKKRERYCDSKFAIMRYCGSGVKSHEICFLFSFYVYVFCFPFSVFCYPFSIFCFPSSVSCFLCGV